MSKRERVEQLKRRLANLQKAKSELLGETHSENQLIVRDVSFETHANLPCAFVARTELE